MTLRLALVLGIAGMAGLCALANAARPRHGDVGTTMFLLDPPAVPLIASSRANPCTVMNVQESIHMDFGAGPAATWEFTLQCRRDPNGRPLTLRFVRPARTCTARGWWRPGTGSAGNVVVIGERCRYVEAGQ